MDYDGVLPSDCVANKSGSYVFDVVYDRSAGSCRGLYPFAVIPVGCPFLRRVDPGTVNPVVRVEPNPNHLLWALCG